MDPSIMKLLEDDEDETMHSGADVEALSAALNRDIAGDASASPPQSDPETVGVFSQGSSHSASQQPSGQWPISSKDENDSQEQHSSQIEPMVPGSSDKDQDQPSGSEPKNDQLQMQQEHPHSDQRPAETNLPHPVEKDQDKITEQTQKTEQTQFQFPEQESTQHSETQQQSTYQHLNVPQQTTDANDVNNSPKRPKASPSIPFQLLMPIIRPHLDKDRSMQLQTVFAKLRSNEVTKEDFLRMIRNIVGDQMLRQAVNKVQVQLQNQATRNPQTNPNQYSLQTQASSQQLLSRGPHQFSEPPFPPSTTMSSSQNQKGRKSPPRPSQVPASTVPLHTNFENNSHKSQDMENKLNGRGMQPSQMYSTSMNTVNPEREVSMSSSPAINKQQQHMHMPHTSFSMYGGSSSNFHSHPYPRPPISHASIALKSQAPDSHVRQASQTQGMLSTQLGSVQPDAAKIQNISNESKRLHGGSFTGHLASQQNPIPWPPHANKEQRGAGLPMAHVKQEVVNQTSEPPHKSQLTTPEGSSFGPGQIDQSKPTLGSFKNEGIEKQSSRMGFSTSSSSIGGHISGLAATQTDTAMQIPSATPPLVGGAATRTPAKKPSVGQKKPFDAVTTPSPQSGKKQKVSGAFHDQSIEHLNDVTAVSGVNLREEEEQLLSAPKEDSRASEATRRVVQEEEEKLILQKGPLEKKLANIMSNCGLKAISSDVERCLSLCVEERLRGLISSLIRMSKQRVDVEKARHRFVITSDVGSQIFAMNRKAKEEWDKKQAEEAEKLRKFNETEENPGGDADKDKDEGRSKTNKVNKEEDDKMRTTAANVAARAAVGGDDMLSKWQLMAEQARQKREGLDGASSSQPGKSSSQKPPPSLKRSLRDQQETDKRGPSSARGSRKFGRSPAGMSQPPPKVARSISTKDVIAVLEREPQMSKSTLIYRMYEKLAGDSAVE
ncbi:transcription initiation factor TFIID subunit 4b-like isoform X1 [Iris pallida]|uniref:Transcription initiation factor TFIID subunit 4b-like isoform X1 n=1 Tax=Iris pallida TaxID=29817 RepID=A0AAX6F2N8_IRIPA|nr:transcription initiation factor TFIID subunit 4b-like isoform X1 [Iris pallida]KAJ6820299.1 transcription initiation factor TFIID subunit 4b-like isoform X1 [Iris pallida]